MFFKKIETKTLMDEIDKKVQMKSIKIHYKPKPTPVNRWLLLQNFIQSIMKRPTPIEVEIYEEAFPWP
jgi:hypothetical protein